MCQKNSMNYGAKGFALSEKQTLKQPHMLHATLQKNKPGLEHIFTTIYPMIQSLEKLRAGNLNILQCPGVQVLLKNGSKNGRKMCTTLIRLSIAAKKCTRQNSTTDILRL